MTSHPFITMYLDMCLCICKFLFFRTTPWGNHYLCYIMYHNVGAGWMLSTNNNNTHWWFTGEVCGESPLTLCSVFKLGYANVSDYFFMNLTVGIFNHWSPSQRIGLLQHFYFSLLTWEQFQAERNFARIVQKLLYTLSPEPLSKVDQLSQYCSCQDVI